MNYTLTIELNNGEIFSYDYDSITTAMCLYFRWLENTCCKSAQIYNNYKGTTMKLKKKAK